jgi:hypothetical protein
LQSQEGELEKCHASDYSGIPDFLQFAATANRPPPGACARLARHPRATACAHTQAACENGSPKAAVHCDTHA